MSLKTRMLDPGLELNPRQRLTQNVVLQTKYFVQRDEMENECSLNKRKLRKVHRGHMHNHAK